MESTPYPKHEAKHALPHTTGITGDGVWCGICKATFQPDAEWASRVLRSQQAIVDRMVAQHQTTQADANAWMMDIRSVLAKRGL